MSINSDIIHIIFNNFPISSCLNSRNKVFNKELIRTISLTIYLKRDFSICSHTIKTNNPQMIMFLKQLSNKLILGIGGTLLEAWDPKQNFNCVFQLKLSAKPVKVHELKTGKLAILNNFDMTLYDPSDDFLKSYL
jgi:hypothetical protein